MQLDELDAIDRWRGFVAEVLSDLLPARGGRLVKSLGDGMLLEFAGPLAAVEAAMDLHERVLRFKRRLPCRAPFSGCAARSTRPRWWSTRSTSTAAA
jgi:class 3 adenylate cyclase